MTSLTDLREVLDVVIGVDRAPWCSGAKSDPLDAIRAAREALARTRLGTPRSGAERRCTPKTSTGQPKATGGRRNWKALSTEPTLPRFVVPRRRQSRRRSKESSCRAHRGTRRAIGYSAAAGPRR